MSPAASVDEDLGAALDNERGTPPSETEELLTIVKRKRSISSSEGSEGSSKRQCTTGQTRHVSEPMPQAPIGTQQQTSTREWFTDIFGLLTDIGPLNISDQFQCVVFSITDGQTLKLRTQETEGKDADIQPYT